MQMRRQQAARIGLRLKAARERAGLTQQQLAAQLGIEHRQTLASIEAGERRITVEELLLSMNALDTNLDYFTDSFRLVGEGRFSFRARTKVDSIVLDRFEDLAGRWIATYRELGTQQGEERHWLEHKLALTPRSTFEDAQAAGEDIVNRWKLGDQPAESLRSAMEFKLDAVVLNVDAPAGISGAASQVPGLNAVLVNRREPEGRRNYDLAHELFHLLTWDVMPPKRVEPVDVPRGEKGIRVEQLAENFAAALLMPEAIIRKRWESRNSSHHVHDWLNDTAADLGVSAPACKWRMYNLGFLSKTDVQEINNQRLVSSGLMPDASPAVLRFSERFVQRISSALDSGRLSVRRAASLLALSIHELSELLQDYGLQPSFEA